MTPSFCRSHVELTVGIEAEHRLYRLLLPRLSAACTESLTPFLSLLPCASHAGLSSLLNPHRLFDAEWTLIGVKVTYEEATEEIRAELEVGAVSDPVRRDRLSGQLGGRGKSISPSSSCFSAHAFHSQAFPFPPSTTAPFPAPAPLPPPHLSTSSYRRIPSTPSRSSPLPDARCSRMMGRTLRFGT